MIILVQARKMFLCVCIYPPRSLPNKPKSFLDNLMQLSITETNLHSLWKLIYTHDINMQQTYTEAELQFFTEWGSFCCTQRHSCCIVPVEISNVARRFKLSILPPQIQPFQRHFAMEQQPQDCHHCLPIKQVFIIQVGFLGSACKQFPQILDPVERRHGCYSHQPFHYGMPVGLVDVVSPEKKRYIDSFNEKNTPPFSG